MDALCDQQRAKGLKYPHRVYLVVMVVGRDTKYFGAWVLS